MKNNGKAMFYSILGILTLIVTIAGGTFAFFTASVSSSGSAISGSSYNELSGAISVNVTKVNFSGSAASEKLVPTNLVESNLNAIKAALTGKCESNGYTACHVYKIVATTTQNLSSVSVKLDSLTVNGATVPSDWKYSIYTGTSDTSATALVTGGNGACNLTTPFDMHNGAALNKTSVTYYLMIFLKDDGAAQNSGDTNDATGSYSGTVTMSAGTGQVKANFTFSS